MKRFRHREKARVGRFCTTKDTKDTETNYRAKRAKMDFFASFVPVVVNLTDLSLIRLL